MEPDSRCAHCGRRPTSPVATGPAALRATSDTSAPASSLPELENDIGRLENSIRELVGATGPKSYSKVKAIFLNWKSCNLDPTVHDETVKLQTLLRDEYIFDAGIEKDIFQIPSTEPTLELDHYVATALLTYSKLDASGGAKLMIVYYNGHGGVDSSNNLIISGGTGNIAHWTGVQTKLESVTAFDIVLIMDCCYAARSIKAIPMNTMDALCASSRLVPAEMLKTGSLFTTSLINNLRDALQKPHGISTGDLYTLLHRDPVLQKQAPNYAPIKSSGRPIVLKPLVQDTVPTSSSVLPPSAAITTTTGSIQPDQQTGTTVYTLDPGRGAPFTFDSPGAVLEDPSGAMTGLNVLFDTGSSFSFIAAPAAARMGTVRCWQAPNTAKKARIMTADGSILEYAPPKETQLSDWTVGKPSDLHASALELTVGMRASRSRHSELLPVTIRLAILPFSEAHGPDIVIGADFLSQNPDIFFQSTRAGVFEVGARVADRLRRSSGGVASPRTRSTPSPQSSAQASTASRDANQGPDPSILALQERVTALRELIDAKLNSITST